MRVDPFFSQGLDSSLNDLSAQQDSLTAELSSGLAVALPSDNPAAAAESVALGSAISGDDAYVSAATGLESQLQVSDSALGSVVTQVTSAIALATEGLNGTLDAADQSSIGAQMAGIRDEVVSLANSSYAGSYLFGGTANSAAPYTNDGSTTPATATYNGDESSEMAETPGGQKIVVSLPGSAIFSAAGADVLGSLDRLVADFVGGAPAATTQADMNDLSAGLANVSTQRGVLGASLNALQQTSTYSSTDEVNLKAAQTSLVQANTATVASGLSADETQQQALISVMSGMDNQKTLFDYLQG